MNREQVINTAAVRIIFDSGPFIEALDKVLAAMQAFGESLVRPIHARQSALHTAYRAKTRRRNRRRKR